MKNIVIGQYVPGTSFLYKLDPRTKIMSLFILMISTFILDSFLQIIIMLAGMLIILQFGGIKISRIIKGLRPIIVLLMFTFTFQVLFIKTGNKLYEFDVHFTLIGITAAIGLIFIHKYTKRLIQFKFLYFLGLIAAIIYTLYLVNIGPALGHSTVMVYDDGITGAFFIMFRLVIIITLSTILTLTTKPTDLNLGLEKLMKPLKVIGLNAEELAMIISIALRYIPTLLDEANKIILAQASRGVDFQEGKLKDKVVQIVSLLVPMFIISFKRSDDLADAMDARSFEPGRVRTRIHILKWTYLDTVVTLFDVFVLIAAVGVRIFL